MLVPQGFNDRNVCIMGLGFVGLTLAVAMAVCRGAATNQFITIHAVR